MKLDILTIAFTTYTTNLEKPEDLIAKADEAMYKAKNMGRNKSFGIEIL